MTLSYTMDNKNRSRLVREAGRRTSRKLAGAQCSKESQSGPVFAYVAKADDTIFREREQASLLRIGSALLLALGTSICVIWY